MKKIKLIDFSVEITNVYRNCCRSKNIFFMNEMISYFSDNIPDRISFSNLLSLAMTPSIGPIWLVIIDNAIDKYRIVYI